MAPKKKKGGKKRRKIDEKVAVKLQSKLKAACIDTAPAKFFKKFDKDKSGDMNAKELSKMIRVSLKISEKELSEADVKALIDALDDDGSGSLSLDELADFVEHGTATFYADHAATEAADAGKRTTKWGAKDEPDEMKKLRRATAAKERKKKTLDEAEMAHFQMKLQAATFGHSPQELFKSFDKSGDGLLNAEELTHLIRVELRIPGSELSDDEIAMFIKAVDDDGTGNLSLAELGDFVEHGTKTFYQDHEHTEALEAAADAADPEHAHKHHKWGERAEECEAAKEDRKARLAKKARPDFDPDEMKKLQGRLQAATYGDDPLHIFRKFDATGDGVLDVPELTKMIRLELKISGSELPDDLIVAFVRAIDDDGSMTLSIDLCANQIFNPTSISLVDLHTGIDELADFVQYGMDTFYADHEETEAKSQAGGHKKGLGWGERAANPACMTVDPGPGDDEASHVSGLSHEGSSLATADNPHALEKTAARIHDDDGGPAGAPAAALSADDLEREIRETEERLRRLKAAKAARARVTTKQIYRPNPKPDSPHALFVDELLDDPLLRLDDCGLEPALRAFRASIVAEAPNNVATATALLKLGNLLRDVAEGREYTLNKATDAHRRALSLVATALSKEHSATLAIRFALADTLLLLKDSKGARAQYQAVLAVQSKQFPPPKTIGRTKERLAKLAEA
ncbi:mRNA splicing protein [Aureococcus anophagefferens]|uniref:mRNA splicing protein n=1 Tax=Aureococcus anophagefferens TaxID=44056 RepID=A0ABR1FR33_AURAN